MFYIKHAALSVYIYCGLVNIFATDVKHIQRRIERERQVEKIKNEIMKNLGNSGIWINRNDHTAKEDLNFGNTLKDTNIPEKTDKGPVNEDITQTTKQEPAEQEKPRNPIISIGEADGTRRDGCLQFSMNRIPKTDENNSSIIPKRINLWVHIRKKKGRSKERKARTKSLNRPERDTTENQNRNKNQKRRKQKGRKIKLFISNGEKRLSKMRMRIRGSGWHRIDLPISQFPDIIYSTDTFKICIQCKRCNKKVKVDIYRKQKSQKSKNKPTIPFIHIETANNLEPHNIYRHKRSHNKNRQHCKQSCCKLETFVVDISKTFPTILAPKEILFTYCLNTCETDIRLHNSSVVYEQRKNEKRGEETFNSEPNEHQRQCLPQTYNAFSFLYLLPNSDVMFGTIPNMFPASCRCSKPTD